jgi:hypothetical protein
MTSPPRNLWLLARLGAVASIGVVAMIFLSSWVLAIVVGAITIAAVVIDAWMLSRSQADQVAFDPNATPVKKLTVDLRHRH